MCAAEMSNMTDLWISGVFFQALNTPKLVCRRGSAPDPAGENTTPPYSLVRWGGGHRLLDLIPFPLDVEVEPWLGLGKLQ